MDWTQILMLFVVIGTNLATVFSLSIHTITKLTQIENEMKDFRDRLCAIEERNKK